MSVNWNRYNVLCNAYHEAESFVRVAVHFFYRSKRLEQLPEIPLRCLMRHVSYKHLRHLHNCVVHRPKIYFRELT